MERDLPLVQQFRLNVVQSQSGQIVTKYFLKIYLSIIISFTYDLLHKICLLKLHIQLDALLLTALEADTLLFQHNLQFIYFMKVCNSELTVETPFSSQEK